MLYDPYPWWIQQHSLGSISLLRELGLGGALGLQLGVFAALAGMTVLVERRRHGRLGDSVAPPVHGWRRLLQGPWPLVWGGVLLALLNAATLALAGHPWNVSFGYTLWGAKAATALGVDVASWEFWTWRYPKSALEGSLFAEATSLMNFGIVAGALLAAGLAGKFTPVAEQCQRGDALYAVLGGNGLLVFGIQFYHPDPGLQPGRSLFVGRCHHLAGAAPGCPEVGQYRDVAAFDLFAKAARGQINRVRGKQVLVAFATAWTVMQAGRLQTIYGIAVRTDDVLWITHVTVPVVIVLA